ncbi:MAG: YHYH protein [Pseudomonadota bacterium]
MKKPLVLSLFACAASTHKLFPRLLLCSALCLSLPTFADDASDASQIFALAEVQYAKYFKPAGSPTQTLQGYLVRYYAETNTYLGVRDGSVYVHGQQFGVGIVRVGAVSDFIKPASTGSGTSTGTNTGSTGGSGSSTAVVDITDLILSRKTSNCADYAGSYKGTGKDFSRNLTFTGNLAVTVSNGLCTFTSNNLPNHTFGQGGAFATAVSAQNYTFKVTTTPLPAALATNVTLTWNSAVLLNGVKVDMFAAACYGVGDGKIGCDNESQAWRYDPMSPKNSFGTDNHNAHTQPDGAYHYHGNPKALFDFSTAVESPVVGFAADGYPLFGTYFKDGTGTVRKAKSSYNVKSGARPSGTGNPGGSYDGTYRDDYEYVSGLGDLDACNGMTVNGVYGYYITDEFPYMTNCFKGTPDASFRKGGGGSTTGGTGGSGGTGGMGGPPPPPPR